MTEIRGDASRKGSTSVPCPDHIKGPVISGLSAMRLTAFAHMMQEFRLGTAFGRAVNYHATPETVAPRLDDQFAYLAEKYTAVGLQQLEQLLSGQWLNSKPALIISFDDGLLSNFTVAAPLLRKHGLTGWFFLPALLIELCSTTAVDDERELARRHRIPAPRDDNCPAVFMRWQHAKELAKQHVIGCHSLSHVRLAARLGEQRLRREILESKLLMEERLQRPVESFCWVGGEHWSYSAEAAKLIRRASYRCAFMNSSNAITPATDPFQLGRTRLEPGWPLGWLEFYTSGILDLARIRSRKHSENITQATAGV
jgi:peptidoglycan/xylan/chitin deacetylase (PgdA/CDA1 family)